MISGRALIAIALIGVGAYVLKKGTDAASSMQGLGADATPEELAAERARLQPTIDAINAIPITFPPMPQVGPKLWQPA